MTPLPTPLLDRLDRAPCELDPLLPAEQLQQHKHAFVRAQGAEQTNLIAEQTADHSHPRARHESTRLRQFDKAVALSGPDLADDSIRNTRRLLTIHHETTHARGPPRIPPTRNNQQKTIARKQ